MGLDNLNDYYSVQLKQDRLAQLSRNRRSASTGWTWPTARPWPAFRWPERFDVVVNLAAQAGRALLARQSRGLCQQQPRRVRQHPGRLPPHGREHLVYASSSSVYGANTQMPFSVHDNVDHPLSLYAATKKANELMAHTYSHLYGLPTTGLRFFTVYGPWGRPDMALYLFTRAILAGRPIDVFNHGHMRRDFTYIDDIVEGVVRVIDRLPQPNPAWSGDAPDPGTSTRPVPRLQHRQQPAGGVDGLIEMLEQCLGRKAARRTSCRCSRATCRRPSPTSTTWCAT